MPLSKKDNTQKALEKAKKDFIKKCNKELEEAEKRINSGKFYTEEQANTMLAEWQKKVLDERLSDYNKNPSDVSDFDKTLKAIEKSV
jgi:hypothetical protein